jgi:hypothetical protein
MVWELLVWTTTRHTPTTPLRREWRPAQNKNKNKNKNKEPVPWREFGFLPKQNGGTEEGNGRTGGRERKEREDGGRKKKKKKKKT